MSKTKITQTHLAVAQAIINFVQEHGWDVDGIEIYRYDADASPFSRGSDPGDEWKEGRKIKWGLALRVGPRDDEELVPVKSTDLA
jgi:hypothetical protein